MHILSQVSLFAGLDTEELNLLQSQGFPLNMEANDYVFHEGSLGHQLYVILDGRVQIVVEDSLNTQNDLVLAELGINDIFGEFTIFDDSPRSASARTLAPTTLLELHKADLWDNFETHPHVGLIIMKNLGGILCERLRAMGGLLKQSW